MLAGVRKLEPIKDTELDVDPATGLVEEVAGGVADEPVDPRTVEIRLPGGTGARQEEDREPHEDDAGVDARIEGELASWDMSCSLLSDRLPSRDGERGWLPTARPRGRRQR